MAPLSAPESRRRDIMFETKEREHMKWDDEWLVVIMFLSVIGWVVYQVLTA